MFFLRPRYGYMPYGVAGMMGTGMMGTGPVTYAQPVVHPTQVIENHTYSTTVVPHVYPTHINNVHHNLVQQEIQHCQTQSNCCVTQNVGCVQGPSHVMPNNMMPNVAPNMKGGQTLPATNVAPSMKGHHPMPLPNVAPNMKGHHPMPLQNVAPNMKGHYPMPL